jgi:hypothetical protein
MLHSQLGEVRSLVLTLAIGLERWFAFGSCTCSLELRRGSLNVEYYECLGCLLDHPELSAEVLPSFWTHQKLKQVLIDR